MGFFITLFLISLYSSIIIIWYLLKMNSSIKQKTHQMETRKRSNGNTVSNKGPKGSKGPKGPKKASVHKPKTDEEKKEKINENARIRRYNRTEEEKK